MPITNTQRDLLSVAYGVAPGIAQALQTADVTLPTAFTSPPAATIGAQTVLQAWPAGSTSDFDIVRFRFVAGEINDVTASGLLGDGEEFTAGHDTGSSITLGFPLGLGLGG